MTQTRSSYSTVAILLHWLIAGAIVFQILLAWRMEDLDTPLGFALMQMHKSVGITILGLSLVRLAWRLANPPPADTLTGWESLLSRSVHVSFYVIMIGLPLTGWLMVSASRYNIPTLLYGHLPWPHLPVSGLPPASKKVWEEVGEKGHEILAWFTYGLLALHVAGALKHQVFDRDMAVVSRMVPGVRAGRVFDPRLIAVGLALLAVAALAWTFMPTLPRSAPLPPAVAPAMSTPGPVTGTTDPAQATKPEAPVAASGPAVWIVAPASTLGFETAWSGTPVTGRFNRWTSDILFDPVALTGSKVRVVIDLASVVTGDAQRDDALPGPDWFDASSHPSAVFTANRFEKRGPENYIAHGKLSLRGVTRPVDLAFKLKIDGDKARLDGVTQIERTAFGVGQGEWQATDQIPAGVKVSVQLTATRK